MQTGHDTARQDELVGLYRSEAPRLAGLARALGTPTAECEDLVQEAFVRLHRAWEGLDRRDRLGGYLHTTVVNLVRDRARRGVRRPVAGAVAIPRVEVVREDEADVLARRLVVDAALESLSSRQRECVVLRYYTGLSDAEIAAATGLSVGSAKTHLRRGLHALRGALGELAGSEDER